MPDASNTGEEWACQAGMFIQEGGIPVPEGADLAVGSWSCPCGFFDYGPFTSSTECVTLWVECPYCHRTAEVQPLLEAGDA